MMWWGGLKFSPKLSLKKLLRKKRKKEKDMILFNNNLPINSSLKLRKFIPVKNLEQPVVIPNENNNETPKTGSEKFWDVRNEMSANLPDRTTTIEEKELAIEYIDRLLACEDIPEDAKEFWTKQREVIEQEIQGIKASQNTNNSSSASQAGESFMDVMNEMIANVPSQTTTIEEKELALEYIDRLLNCSDITDELKEYWTKKKAVIQQEIENIKNMDKAGSGEKFADVFAEMQANLPDSTSTIEEKELALEYIDRLLNCSDITDELKEYWTNKQSIIRMELVAAENYEKDSSGVNWLELSEELNMYADLFKTTKSFDDDRTRIEYWTAYHNGRMSYYTLLLNSDGLTENDKADIERMMEDCQNTLTQLKKELEELKKQESDKPVLERPLRRKVTPFLFIKNDM